MSTSPPSSGSSSDNSPSPSISLHDLKTDPSDALDFILQSMTDSNTDSSQDNSPPDWSQLSSWAQTDTKFDLTSDFNFSLPMDMDLDFDPNMAVDPSALHFTSIFDQSALSMAPIDNNPYLMSSEMASNPLLYPMPDESTWNSHVQLGTGRRLSVTSSSSSSGASLSPVIESTSVVSSSPPSDLCLSDPASELAQRVRQMAGVTLAVPVSAQVQQLAAAVETPDTPPRPSNPSPAAKRPSPKPDPESSTSTPASEKADSPAAEAPPASSTTVIGRPKTSHTTIERRYRTNLNARITGLKQVLKKRESRLKREQDGLKSLVSGLVGGPALLKEWEREWKERFGGEEKDEVEDDDAAGSDDEDDGEDTDGEDEDGRARKKAKVAKVQKKEKP
ncbi:hypothetical protein A0H81_02608 [Grifola frondosa]|uniref:Uncharacterized protein n=1 Tax=Grifola frondosa TaxID=5627 RepID=A0A1C7MLK9_GRIFR|nr:hypothetical protein A0H81_02608 [Grifola frondosa]